MPLSASERNKRYREKLRAKFDEAVLKKKEAARKKTSRLQDVELSREKERERQQRCRVKKEANQSNLHTPVTTADSPVFKSVSSLGKAVKRAQVNLPKSPRKRQKV